LLFSSITQFVKCYLAQIGCIIASQPNGGEMSQEMLANVDGYAMEVQQNMQLQMGDLKSVENYAT
jgi:hypothetical protein